MCLGICECHDNRIYPFVYHTLDDLFQSITIKDLFPQGIDDLPLFIHDIIILKEVFSYIKVVCLNLSLGILDSLGDQVGLYWLPLLHAEPSHNG